MQNNDDNSIDNVIINWLLTFCYHFNIMYINKYFCLV